MPIYAKRISLILALSLALTGCDLPGSDQDPQLTQISNDQLDPALRLARASRSSGDFTSAINLYRGITADETADPAVVVEMGDTMLDAGAIDDAIGVYNQIPDTSPVKANALLGLERAYFTLNDANKAMAYADKAAALAPADEKVLIGRGIALDIMNRHDEAQTSYRTVLTKKPHNLAARNDLALSLALSGQYKEACDIMMSIAKSTTSTPRTRQNLALIYGLMGDKKHAQELSLVDLSPEETNKNLRFFDFVKTKTN